ncbi:hypothetical protein F2Q69_00029379 [Brassica cretica]|uniref:Uncharacterized protein n=1 Tax=Brassica cretica TaxID=69181 RepID=A0A8S9RUM3_BRACR|nr:hypothetical protein F2Q69_00029379 [Brassica cretica]
MSESPQKNRISFKTSKAEETNSRNGSPGKLSRDTGQLVRRDRVPGESSAATRASSPGEHDRVVGRLTGELGRYTSQLAR